MPQDRVASLLAAYFNQSYVEYGEFVLEIRTAGGLTAEEARVIKKQILFVDAKTIIRQAGVTSE